MSKLTEYLASTLVVRVLFAGPIFLYCFNNFVNTTGPFIFTNNDHLSLYSLSSGQACARIIVGQLKKTKMTQWATLGATCFIYRSI